MLTTELKGTEDSKELEPTPDGNLACVRHKGKQLTEWENSVKKRRDVEPKNGYGKPKREVCDRRGGGGGSKKRGIPISANFDRSWGPDSWREGVITS